MKKHPNTDKSDVGREAIIKRIEIEDRLEAVRRIEEIKKSVKPVEKGQLDKWIREHREIWRGTRLPTNFVRQKLSFFFFHKM